MQTLSNTCLKYGLMFDDLVIVMRSWSCEVLRSWSYGRGHEVVVMRSHSCGRIHEVAFMQSQSCGRGHPEVDLEANGLDIGLT